MHTRLSYAGGTTQVECLHECGCWHNAAPLPACKQAKLTAISSPLVRHVLAALHGPNQVKTGVSKGLGQRVRNLRDTHDQSE